MEKILLGFILGLSFTGFLLSISESSHIKTSKQKPTIDYRLKANGKQIDTIWIYNFKKQ